jgi:hypothetical protein
MDDNTKEVLVLLITTFSTIAIAWIKVRSISNHQSQQAPSPPPSTQDTTS